jgi:eukaryotic-like serine/threonine-protein kinase
MIGKTVGKYRIVDRLGRGGMGTVYKAVDETLDREVAIKVLNPDLGDSDLLKRFRAEAVTLARLNHPGIATLYELHRQDDDLLMVMEFVRGETFHDLSERLGPLAAPQAAYLCMQVLDALSHAHRAGVVHRDLKPANLMVTETGTVKVMDFGIARVLGTEHFTHGGYMMGTPAYMAPEQVMGTEIDARADLYAVGVVFYRLLSAQLPFDADTAIAMVQKQISSEPTPIKTFCPDLPDWCTHVIDRALTKSPADRFQSAEEFRTALAQAVRPQALGELPTTATPTPPGLAIDPELTLPYDLGRTARSGAQLSGAAGAHTTPAVRAITAANPAGTPPSGSLERTTGTTVVLGRTHLAAIAALVVVLAVGVAVLGFAAMRRSSLGSQLPMLGTLPQASTPSDAAADAGAQAPQPQTPEAPNTPPAVQSASNRDVAATAGAGAAIPAGGASTSANSRTAPPPSSSDARAEPGAADPAAAKTAPLTPLPATAASPVVFDDVRVLVTDEGNKGRERDAVLQLGNARISVLERADGPSIASIPYKTVLGAFYSRSKQPKWKDADGKEVESKVDLGRLGFLRGERNWLILLTKSEPVIIRIEDSDLKTVLPAFTEQTGIVIQR